VLRFDYQSIELAKIPTEEFRKMGLKGLLPLLILTREGARHEVVEEVVEELEAAEEYDLLVITQLLASLVFASEEDRQWIIWRFSKMAEKLRDTWAYKELTKEGREEGRRQGELLALRQAVVDLVQARFPELTAYAQKQVEKIEDLTLIRSLIVKVGTAATVQETAQSLIVEDSNGKKV
jgi:hypothetical protein